MTTQTIKQTAVSEHLIRQLRVYAAQNGLLLQELYEQAILNLINRRRELQEQGLRVAYLASVKQGKELNMKLRSDLASRIARIAEADGTSVRRFLYTALFQFAKDHKLNLIEVDNGY